MLSKKYYKVFAEILKTSESKDEIKAKLIRFMISDNPNFNITTFDNASKEENTCTK